MIDGIHENEGDYKPSLTFNRRRRGCTLALSRILAMSGPSNESWANRWGSLQRERSFGGESDWPGAATDKRATGP